MKLKSPRTPRPEAIVDINLLPRGVRPADVTPLAVLLGVAVLVAVLATVPLAFVAHDARQDAAQLERQATEAERGLHGIQLSADQKYTLQAQLTETNAQIKVLQTARERLQGGKRSLSEDLSALIAPGVVPPGTRLASVSGTDTGMRIDGAAAGPLDAIAYANKLAHAGGFPAARMSSFAPGHDGGQFTIEVTR